jgi:DNA polymerase
MDSGNTYWDDRALLEWQVELGADDAIQDTPVDRYALEAAKPKPKAETPGAPPVAPEPVEIDVVAEAGIAAKNAVDLPSLAVAVQAFEHCEIKRGARACVFGDGDPAARIMIVTEAPDRDEDRAGKPFVAGAGQLLDNMLSAIDLSRSPEDPTRGVYIVPVMPWRIPSNRAADPAEIAMMLPFLERHIALADPDFVILMGNGPCQALLKRTGITRLRGTWVDALGKPCLPMFPPNHLMRNSAAKRDAWADLLDLNARLNK